MPRNTCCLYINVYIYLNIQAFLGMCVYTYVWFVQTLVYTNPTAPKITACREHRGKGKLSTYVRIYLFTCSAKCREVTTWEKLQRENKQHIFSCCRLRSARIPGAPSKTYLRSKQPGRFCPCRFTHSVCIAAFSRCAALLRFDSRDPNIDIFTVPFTM